MSFVFKLRPLYGGCLPSWLRLRLNVSRGNVLGTAVQSEKTGLAISILFAARKGADTGARVKPSLNSADSLYVVFGVQARRLVQPLLWSFGETQETTIQSDEGSGEDAAAPTFYGGAER